MKRFIRSGAVVLGITAALMLSGCSESVAHNRAMISVGSSGTTNASGKFVPLYVVDLTVSSKEYPKLTGVKTDCTGSPCKAIEGVAISKATFDKFATAEQRTSLSCLEHAGQESAVFRYQLFSAAGSGKKDSTDGVWYPQQFQTNGSRIAVLSPYCYTKLTSSLDPTDIPIAKG